MRVTIRPIGPTDSIPEVTRLVHAAYKQLGDMGFRYWGTWQSDDDTRLRCSEGFTLIAEEDREIVGTVTAKQIDDPTDPDWYRAPGTWIITQFAVEPGRQRSGLGSQLMVEAERHAFEQCGTEAAIDTAEGATHLIDYYKKRGYRHVGKVDWDGTNYVSVIMSKRLRPRLTTDRLVLREITADDVPTFQRHWTDPRFQAAYPPGRMTPEHCEQVFTAELAAMSVFPRTSYHWAIECEGTMIGGIRLTVGSGLTGTIGYGIDANEWGKGYMSEAVGEVLRYAFDELQLARVQAWVFANNGGSRRVLEKSGFTYEGALREKVLFGDTRVDDEIFGILRREWQATAR